VENEGFPVWHSDDMIASKTTMRNGRVKILDSGLAKLKQPVGDDVRSLTSKPGEKSSRPVGNVVSYKAPTLIAPTVPSVVLGPPAYRVLKQEFVS
jgi:hypothetical protein